MTDLAETIARLRELEAKATPAPWEAGTTALGGGPLHRPVVTAPDQPLPRPFLIAENVSSAGDAELIAALRSALPALLDAAERAERLEKENAALSEQNAFMKAGRRPFSDAMAERTIALQVKEIDRLAARVKELEAMLNEPPILSKYHGMRGFEEDRFIDDYGEWRRRVRALLEPTP